MIDGTPPKRLTKGWWALPAETCDMKHRLAYRSRLTCMAPQTSGPLQQQIDRCEIRYQTVEIQIQTLLCNLGCYKDLAPIPDSLLSEDL